MSDPVIARKSNFAPGIGFALVVVFAVVATVFFQTGAVSFSSLYTDFTYKSIKIGTLSLRVKVARTPAEQLKSLNNIPSIPQNEGMLFVFDQDGIYNMSTQDMLFPVDLMWLDTEGTIVDAQANVAPGLRDPVHPQATARYVLMVNAGVMDHNDIAFRASVDLLNAAR